MKLIEKAAIAAMQGILANSNTNVNAIDIAEKAMLHANSLLTIMNIPNMNGEDLTNYIMQVDETHADNEISLNEKIEQLEYVVRYNGGSMERVVDF